MRIGFAFRLLAVATVTSVAVAACTSGNDELFNPKTPSAAKARVRVLNATNITLDLSSPAAEWTSINGAIRHGASRCFELDPNTAPLVRDSATQTLYTTVPSTFEAGKAYDVLAYMATTTATSPTFTSWQSEEAYTPPTDSAGIRFFNASPNAGAIDIYANPVAATGTTAPALTAANRVVTNLPVGSASPYLNFLGGTNFQLRITRTGSTTSANTLIDATQTGILRDQTASIILGIPSQTAATTFRQFSAGGC